MLCISAFRFTGCSTYSDCRVQRLISPSSLILLSLLLALNKPKVNYFSLDIEGAELQVLRSVPWNLVDIEVRNIPVDFLIRSYILKVISVEIPLLGQVFPGSREEVCMNTFCCLIVLPGNFPKLGMEGSLDVL